jgi:four helix bundle protein
MVDGVKLQSFEQLTAWRESQNLAVLIYKITRTFPKEEKFGITSQVRRAVSSVSANIAEGFGRYSQKDKLHFYTIVYGSLLETKNFIYLTKKLEFIDTKAESDILEQIDACQRLLNALMATVRRRT